MKTTKQIVNDFMILKAKCLSIIQKKVEKLCTKSDMHFFSCNSLSANHSDVFIAIHVQPEQIDQDQNLIGSDDVNCYQNDDEQWMYDLEENKDSEFLGIVVAVNDYESVFGRFPECNYFQGSWKMTELTPA
jgi:hypothetical protein